MGQSAWEWVRVAGSESEWLEAQFGKAQILLLRMLLLRNFLDLKI